MPDEFGLQPPLLRKVVVAGIRPCSLVTDDLTCETNYGPTSTWDSAASQWEVTLALKFWNLAMAVTSQLKWQMPNELLFLWLKFIFHLNVPSDTPKRFSYTIRVCRMLASAGFVSTRRRGFASPICLSASTTERFPRMRPILKVGLIHTKLCIT